MFNLKIMSEKKSVACFHYVKNKQAINLEIFYAQTLFIDL